jgi:integrase
MKTENTETVSLWTKAPVANLVRYEPSGIYFARAKVRGKPVRKSLDTNILSVAKLRLADVINAEHRAVAPSQTKIVGKMTFGDALAIFRERQKHATDIKASTQRYNERAAIDLLKTWPDLKLMDVKRITKFDCLEWRARFGKMYAPTVINGTLSVLRRVLDIAVDSGARYDNPAKAKDVKRARVRRKELQLPEPDQFLALVKTVRMTGSRDSGNCGDAIEFFSYTGTRLSEAAKIYGRDCSFLKNEIIIRGDLLTGTKNWEIRRVPMIPEVRKLLERLKKEHGEREFLDNPVLKVRKFNRSLKNACKKLGLYHLTHHDLRHLFATRCIESSVDIPTVAKWLGHKDGGVLAMQTYGHLAEMMRLSPRIKPAGIKFAANQRAGRLQFAELGKITRRVAAEIRRLKKIGHQTVAHLVRRIAFKEWHVKTGGKQGLADVVHIERVLAIEAVFIFYLHHDDRPAVRDLQWTEFAANLLKIMGRGGEITRIAAAELDVIVFQQPPRRTAHLPFGARVRAGTQDDPQTFRLREATKFRDIRLTAPVKHARVRLNLVPEKIRADGVQTHRLRYLQAVTPIFARDTRGVNFSAANLKRMRVQQKIIRADGERMLNRLAGRQRQTKWANAQNNDGCQLA